MAALTTADLIDAIRHSCIISDDHGIAERIVPPPTRRPPPGVLRRQGGKKETDRLRIADGSDDDEDYGYEKFYDNQARRNSNGIEPDFGTTRPRSATQMALDAIVQQDSSDIKRVTRHDIAVNVDNVNYHEFVAQQPRRVSEKRTSVVSEGIRASVDEFTSDNPFHQYRKFAADPTSPVQSKSFEILFAVTPSESDRCTIKVTVDMTARVIDFIGLCCFVYTEKDMQPPLVSTSLHPYVLYMCDEGDIEDDLPPLSNNDPIARVGFISLALVCNAVEGDDHADEGNKEIHVYWTDGTEYTLTLTADDERTVGWLRDDAVDRINRLRPTSGAMTREKEHYVVHRLVDDTHSGKLELENDTPLVDTSTDDFVVMRNNSSRDAFDLQRRRVSSHEHYYSSNNQTRHSNGRSGTVGSELSESDSFVYTLDNDARKQLAAVNIDLRGETRSWTVNLPLKRNIQAEMEVSSRHIDLVRYEQKRRVFGKPKRLTLLMADVGGVAMTDEHSARSTTVSIFSPSTLVNGEWKEHQVTPVGHQDAHDIVALINHHLDRIRSPVRNRYNTGDIAIARSPMSIGTSFVDNARPSRIVRLFKRDTLDVEDSMPRRHIDAKRTAATVD